MVFMRDRRAEQGEDTVAGLLGDITVIVMDGVDHQLQRRIDNGAGVLRVEVLDQLHRALDIGEQRGDGFALALERGISGFCAYLDGGTPSGSALRFTPCACERL